MVLSMGVLAKEYQCDCWIIHDCIFLASSLLHFVVRANCALGAYKTLLAGRFQKRECTRQGGDGVVEQYGYLAARVTRDYAKWNIASILEIVCWDV